MIETQTDVSVVDTPVASELLRFERLLSDVSAGFIDLPAARIDEAIEDGLRRIVETLGIDRSTLSSVDPDSGHFHATHSWALPGLPKVPTTVSSATFPWVLATMRAGKPIVFASLDEMPPEASQDRRSYAETGLKSHVAVPVIVAGELMAVLGIGALRSERAWSADLVGRMRLLAQVFASALARKRAQEQIDQALAFERLLVDIPASLAGASEPEQEIGVTEALRRVTAFLVADHGTLWEFAALPMRLIAKYRWTEPGVLAPSDEIPGDRIPWICEELLAERVVTIDSVDDMPAAAQVDQDALRAEGVRSLLAVPLRSKGVVVAALSLATLRGELRWPPVVASRLRVAGKFMLSMIARERAEAGERLSSAEAAHLRDRLAHMARVHAVGAMSAAIAHEVNQPLMAIANYARAGRRRLAGTDPIDRGKLDELLDKVAMQAALAGEVLNRLRAMVKRHDAEMDPVDVGQMVAKTLKLVEMESDLNGVRIDCAIDAGLPPVLADDIQIQQVLLNLVRNAMEAMTAIPGQKVLRIEAMANGNDDVIIRVVDRGPGIAVADEEKIFEPFFTTKATGLGIGLSICRTIVDAHGGRLWHAPNPEGGATLQFTLPIATEAD